jgi:hypothetical protein
MPAGVPRGNAVAWRLHRRRRADPRTLSSGPRRFLYSDFKYSTSSPFSWAVSPSLKVLS